MASPDLLSIFKQTYLYVCINIIMLQQNIDEIKDRLPLPSAQNTQNIGHSQQIPSKYLPQYCDFFEVSPDICNKPHEKILEAIKGHNISFDNEQRFYKFPEIKIVNNSSNYQFLSVEIRIGYYTFHQITIASIHHAFPHKLTNYEGRGSFGRVFKIRFLGQDIALKIVLFPKSDSKAIILQGIDQKVIAVLKQYCMSKLASAVEAGPVISGQMGFDILFYNDCIAYPMEYCQNNDYQQSFTDSQQSLKGQLLRLHAIKFIHMDIKQDNICFSKIKKRFIFIDFGLSTIIPESLGYKSFTQFYGTATHCCQEMSNLITKQGGGQVDLYYNDLCCLKNVIKGQQNEWQISQLSQETRRYAKDGMECNYQANYQKSIMPTYLKYLVYRLSFDQFKKQLQIDQKNISKLDLAKLLSFMKGMNFSNRLLVVSRQIACSLDYLSLDAECSPQSELKLQEQKAHHSTVFSIVDNINCLNSITPIQRRLLRSIKDRQVLLKLQECLLLNWKVFIKLLLEAIQINIHFSTYQEKLKYCKVAKQVFRKIDARDIVLLRALIVQRVELKKIVMDDLEVVSLILFCFSLQGPSNNIKIAVFHSMIYNVVLLKVLDVPALLSFYNRLQHINMDFSQKMRMLLKFKTTLFWYHFQINCPLYERVDLIEQINQLNSCFQEQVRLILTESQFQLLKIINVGFLFKQTRHNLRLINGILDRLAKSSYSELNKDDTFMKQVRLWVICNFIQMNITSDLSLELEDTVFQQINKKQVRFEYYHLFFLIYRYKFGLDKKQCNWIIDRFQKIFQGSSIGQRYHLSLIKQAIILHNNRFKGFHKFLQHIQGIGMEQINTNSLIGMLVSEVMHKIIQDKSIREIPADVRAIYDPKCAYLLNRYDFRFPEKMADRCLSNILQNIVKQEYYTFSAYQSKDIQAIIQPKFRNYQCQLRTIIINFEQKQNMNFSLLSLNIIIAYLLFRQSKFQQTLQIMKYIYACIDILDKQDNICIYQKENVSLFFFKLALTKPFKKHFKKGEFLIAYQKYFRLIETRSLSHRILNDQTLFIEIFLFMIYSYPQEAAQFINNTSYDIIITNSSQQALNYYKFLQKIYLSGLYLNILHHRNKNIILQRLTNVRLNPYNAVYLHFSMRIPQLWSQRIFLQICYGLNLVKNNISTLIKKHCFLYFFAFFQKGMSQRRRKCLNIKCLKYEQTNKSRLLSTILSCIIIERQQQQWKKKKNVEKFQIIKCKIAEYFIDINIRGSFNKKQTQLAYFSAKFNKTKIPKIGYRFDLNSR